MKTSGWLSIGVLVSVALLQGCASTGGVAYAPSAAPGSSASKAAASAPVVSAIHTKSDFDAVHAAVEQQMRAGGRYGSVDPASRATVDGRFQDMAALFEQYDSTDKMGPTAMARINDDQNAINAALAAHDGNRLICHNETPVGSHLPTRVCRTLSQIQNDEHDAQQTMRIESMRPSQFGGH